MAVQVGVEDGHTPILGGIRVQRDHVVLLLAYHAHMITVHHLNNSRSQRVLWLLEEIGLPYEVRRYQRDPATMLAPPELKAVHPLGKSPVLTDGPLVLAESGAILEYLVETHGDGRFVPAPGTPERLRYRYWLHYAEGSAMPPLLLKLVFDRIGKASMPFFAKPVARAIAARARDTFIQPQIDQHLDFMEAELGRSAWFAGDAFTAADVQISFPLEAAAARAGLDARRPRLMDFLSRIHARPAYQRAVQRGGEYGIVS
jgi:glutathione S-transferase